PSLTAIRSECPVRRSSGAQIDLLVTRGAFLHGELLGHECLAIVRKPRAVVALAGDPIQRIGELPRILLRNDVGAFSMAQQCGNPTDISENHRQAESQSLDDGEGETLET